MNKIRVILFLVGLMGTVVEGGAQDNVRLPSVLPPAPNSAELGKFGDIPINHSTGALNLTVPIVEIGTKNLSVPVSVRYSSNGLRVNTIASNAGFDWVLEAGGVITRTIMDEPDLFPGTQRLAYPNFNVRDQALLNYLNAASNESGWDTEPDVFYFNFNGISGKFVFNDNEQAVLIPHDNIKIEFTYLPDLNLKFTVTTADGIRYIFGGPTATEFVKSISTIECGWNGMEPAGDEAYPSAWYLIRIEHPAGDFVDFEYESGSFMYYSNVKQTLTRPTGSTASDMCVFDPGTGAPIITRCQEYPYSPETCNSLVDATVVRVKQITSSGYGKLVFNYKSRNDIDDKLISDIVLMDESNSQIQKTVFEHQEVEATEFLTGLENRYRPFLTKIKEFGKTNAFHREHSFFYNDLDHLPGRMTFAQDHDGYYNGKPNTVLVPLPKDFSDRVLFNNIGADRNPDPAFSSKGLLNKVIYPTGGYSEISYEANDHYTTEEVETPLSVNVNAQGSDQAYFNNDHIFDSETFSINWNQNVFITASFSHVSGVVDQDHHIKMMVIIIDNTTGLEIFSEPVLQNQTRNLNPYLTVGNYTLKIDIFGYDGYTGSAMLAYSSFQNLTYNKVVPGVRVQKITAFDAGRNIGEVKKYLYRYPENSNQSSGRLTVPNHTYVSNFKYGYVCKLGPSDVFGHLKFCYYRSMNSNSLTASRSLMQNNIFYEAVILSNGENFENGGIEYRYLVTLDAPAFQMMGDYIPDAGYSNFGYDNGALWKENAFKSVSGNKIYLSKREFVYKVDTRIDKSLKGVYSRKNFHPIFGSTPPNPNQFDPYDVAVYDILARWNYLETVTNTIYDENGLNPVVNTVNYYYDNPVHALRTRVVTNDSRQGIVTQEYKFPQDLSFSGAEEVARVGLINKYQIGTVIEESSTHNSSFLKQHIVFKEWFPGKYFPEKLLVNSGPGASMEERMIYDGYASSGGVLSVAKKEDLSTSYVWDHKLSFPIAEIKNAISSSAAYTSFEGDGTGNWSGVSPSLIQEGSAVTGNRYYAQANFVLTKAGLPASTPFVVSYWSKNGTYAANSTSGNSGFSANGWTYFEHLLSSSGTGDIILSGSGSIDELRLYPKGAFMTTSTYNPLIGITSKCDVNNLVTYFEYDNFRRLSLIRDREKSIIKRICYNYSGHPEECPLANNGSPQWRPTGQTRCLPCPANSNYLSGIGEREERDINPGSPTAGTTRWVIDGTVACPSPPNWLPRNDLAFCESINGVNNGNYVTPTYDANPCSQTYGQWGTPIIISNHPPCMTCNPGCNTPEFKCINGVCVQGTLVVVKAKKIGKAGPWECSWAYCYPDQTISSIIQVTTSSTACPITCF